MLSWYRRFGTVEKIMVYTIIARSQLSATAGP
ncbi:hypothetical protein C8E89_13635 [Mycolicibacterium moriokaense]|uniref:Uncharacterized protein n=1 Tax=Mycolicibacterium moriokaense TaxID=39691 RepID=A0A318HBS7_9MYCO|nr:hypothetical protein C8E89_13635 [Mycolicibacterium moriokaense]